MENITFLKGIKAAKTDLINSKTLREWAKAFSKHTWNHIGFARSFDNSKVKAYEVTITQNLILEFFLKSYEIPNQVSIWEAEDETANGNDLEIVINGVKIPCQAKLLYKTQKYGAFDEKQKDALITYAEANKGFPLYLFYNYTEDSDSCDNKYIKRYAQKYAKEYAKKDENFCIGHLGCTIASAKVLKDAKLPKQPSFQSIHPERADPFNWLFTKNFSKLSFKADLNACKRFSEKELELEGFKRISIYPKMSFNTIAHLEKMERLGLTTDAEPVKQTQYSLFDDTEYEFRPKYRIVANISGD